MADDPGSIPAPRPRRRRPSPLEDGLESSSAGQYDDASPPMGPEAPTPGDDTPLPTFLHAAPGREAAREQDIDVGWVIEPAVPGTPPARSVVDHGWLPMLDDRSPDPDTCPVLRAVDDTNRLVAPIEAPDTANRCAALRDAVPQSLRQQELVCLAASHVNCPRYLRGAVVIADVPEPEVRTGRSLTPAVLASLVILVMAASSSLAFVLARGGLELAAAAPTSSPVASAAAVAEATATPSPTIVSTPTPAPTVTPTASPSPSPSPPPTPTPPPIATPTLVPTLEPTPEPAATSDRYALLRPCPDAPRCWIYRVRAGDNLASIANYFGVSLDSIYDRNPWTRTQGLRAGQELRLPPPTR